MGMLDDAFKKKPEKKQSTTRKRMKSTSLVPYGSGRQGTMPNTPLFTPPPKQSTSLTIYKPKPITVRRRPAKQKQGSQFDFQNPFGTKASQPSGFGSNVGASQTLGTSSGISAGKRHKGKVVGGIGAKLPRRGERGGGLSIDDSLRAGRAAGRTVVKPIGRGALKVVGWEPDAKKRKAEHKKNRAAIGKQFKKGIHDTLFKGKKRLI